MRGARLIPLEMRLAKAFVAVPAAQWSLKKEDTKAIFKKHMKAGARRTDTSRGGAWDLILNPKSEKPPDI